MNFSLSWRYDKLKLIGHQTDPVLAARGRSQGIPDEAYELIPPLMPAK
jgi:hypothetical protein